MFSTAGYMLKLKKIISGII